jgi:hypothetical protein
MSENHLFLKYALDRALDECTSGLRDASGARYEDEGGKGVMAHL